MVDKVTYRRYRWIVNSTIAALLVMLIYVFLGSVLVGSFSSGRLQLLFYSSGVYNSYGFLLTPIYAFAFWLIVILGIYSAAITGRNGKLLKLAPMYIPISFLATMASVGIVIVMDGFSVLLFSKGVPFQFSELRIALLLHTHLYNLFQLSYFLLDMLFWFIFFISIGLIFFLFQKRGIQHPGKFFHRVTTK